MATIKHGQRGDMRTNLIIGGVIALVLLLLTIFAVAQLTKPAANSVRGVADRYVSALFKADARTTYALNTDNYKQRITESDWDQFITKSYTGYKGTGPTFMKSGAIQDPFLVYAASLNPQQVVYDTTLNNTTYAIKLILVTDGGSWKIDEMESDKL